MSAQPREICPSELRERRRIVPIDRMKKFLQADLKDALKWLFVGAIVWQGAKEKEQECCF